MCASFFLCSSSKGRFLCLWILSVQIVDVSVISLSKTSAWIVLKFWRQGAFRALRSAKSAQKKSILVHLSTHKHYLLITARHRALFFSETAFWMCSYSCEAGDIFCFTLKILQCPGVLSLDIVGTIMKNHCRWGKELYYIAYVSAMA